MGRRLLHYEVLEILGEGGMGVVYRARDTKLGRDVALKVLPEDLSNDPDRLERFGREARALAALDHPNIVTVYSVENDGGVHFLTMGLAEGTSLDQKLRRGPLAPAEFHAIAIQLAEALAAAHAKGVIHRDLKPANVMVMATGRIKVLDFGLAKLTESDDAAEDETQAKTRAGAMMGTAPYMSPEQVHGEAADQRSDIFSLGVVFYEMLSGSRPFTGNNAATLFSSILRDEPAPLESCSNELAAIVQQCLAKRPSERFQTAEELRAELEQASREPNAATSGATVPRADDAKVVVVLPFANRSADPDNEYFSDGLTEEVISDLAQVSALRVISRNSAMALKGTSQDTPTLARELGVSHLVTGSVRRSGNALRVTAELVDAATDAPIWSDKYSGTAEDVFGIQEQIARKIVAALEMKLTRAEDARVAERPIEDPVAYDAYFRARREMYLWTAESTRRALRLVDDALHISKDNPLLLATKGQIHWINANVLLADFDDSLDLALDLANRALATDPASHLGIFVRGLVNGLRGNVEQALEDLCRAHELQPGDANVVAELIRFANSAGLRTQGALVEEIVRIDPLTPISHACVGTYETVNGRHQASAVASRRVIEMSPDPSPLHILSAWQIAEAGFHSEAARVLRDVGNAFEGTMYATWSRFLAHALEGQAHSAADYTTPGLERVRGDHFSRWVADGFALIGRNADAIRWTRAAIDAGFINYPCLSEHDPFLESVRSEPEFQKLMEALRPRWEAVVRWERERGGL